MIRFLVILLCFLCCSFNYNIVKEKIYSFHSDIQIQEDGSVLVTEKIELRALGDEIKRGIYRDIPLNFRLPEGTVRQRLKVLKVQRDGKSEPFRTDMIEGGIRIYIGSTKSNVPIGTRRYELTYELDRTAYCDEEECKVMWNVNGDHWNFEIDSLSATISTPNSTKILSHDGWRGGQAVFNEKNFESKSLAQGEQFFMTKRLVYRDNFTILVTFSKDVILPVSTYTQFIYFLRDNSLIIVSVLGLLLSFIVNFILWIKHGKDPREGTIVPQFYPPEDWSPAEVLYLINEGKEDNNMFAAQLLQLAVKGHIKITKTNTKNQKDEFKISSTDKSTKKQELTELEQGFLHKLLGKKEFTVIRETYNPHVAAANNYQLTKIEKSQSGLYFNKNTRLILPQYLIPVLTIIGMVISFNYHGGFVWLIPLMAVILLLMNIKFLQLFYQPTQEGRRILDHILGFERFIKYADELRINTVNKPDFNFEYFEKNLPYAVAFGKADEWGKMFNSQEIDKQFKSSNYHISGYTFQNFGYISALSALSSTASVPPSSAGSSGGGFSGGGFSGGGAGGGGGGGW